MIPKWSVVYEKAEYPDGRLLFPERLSREFLDEQRKTMGSYFYANQYLNTVIPEEERKFKPAWKRYYGALPIKTPTFTFAFVDPAIGQKDHHDYTGIVVAHVTHEGIWYVPVATRYRLTPTEIVEKLFEINAQFKPLAIGVESVAYQEALIYFAAEEMKKRRITLPLKEIKRSSQSKESRILGLVPRFEWGRIFLSQGLKDLEDELETFPRGSFDDLLDALASIEEIVFYPDKVPEKLEKPHSPDDPNYERWVIQQMEEKGRHGGAY
jgi:predicted phage terminase large subunit-like protein